MIPAKKRSALASQQRRFRMWFVLMVIMSLPLWVGGCGKGPKTVVAEVNGQRITVKDIQDELARIPANMRPVYEQNPEEVLDQLISLTLLLQEAKLKGVMEAVELRDLGKPFVQAGIRRFLEPELKDVKVTDQEVAVFYQRNRDQVGGKPLSQVREALRRMLLELKKQEKVKELVAKLRATAAITAYPERLPKPPPPALKASTADDFQAALKSGRPTVVDFGSNSCIPCIQLRPVLRGVKDAHKERINVLVMEVSDHRDLARQYTVRLVPTLIFFDAKGNEVRRSVGFMDRDAIEGVLRDLKFLGV